MKTLQITLLALLCSAGLAQAAETEATLAADSPAVVTDADAGGMQHGRMGWGREGGEGRRMHGRHGGMMGRIPDLTAEQKTRLQAIAKAAMSDIKPLREQMHAARVQNSKLFTAPTIDRSAAEKARAGQASLRDAIAKRMLQARLDAAEVLTPAQRAKLAERRAKREDMTRQRMQRWQQMHPK